MGTKYSVSHIHRCAADLVLRNGRICTMKKAMPWASAVAIAGNKIVAVLPNDAEVAVYIGTSTHVVDLDGRFMLPGFIDSHVHLASAGALLNGANLLAVSDDIVLREEISRVAAILEPGQRNRPAFWFGLGRKSCCRLSITSQVSPPRSS